MKRDAEQHRPPEADERKWNAHFVYSRQHVAPMVFSRSVLGTSSAIFVAGHDGRILLPGLSAPKGRSVPDLVPPARFGVGTLSVHTTNPRRYWGQVLSWPAGTSAVYDFVLEFSLSNVLAQAEGAMAEIEENLETWFTLLRTWIEILTSQDVSIMEPVGGTARSLNHMWSWTPRTRWRSVSGPIRRPLIIRHFPSELAITVSQWTTALHNASEGEQPSRVHVVLNDSRRRFRRQQYSYAVILAGIAAEIALKSRVEAELYQRHNPPEFVEHVLSFTLGRLERIARFFAIDVPDDFQAGLIRTRNRALHEGFEVSEQDATRALDLAHDLIEKWFPSPSI